MRQSIRSLVAALMLYADQCVAADLDWRYVLVTDELQVIAGTAELNIRGDLLEGQLYRDGQPFYWLQADLKGNRITGARFSPQKPPSHPEPGISLLAKFLGKTEGMYVRRISCAGIAEFVTLANEYGATFTVRRHRQFTDAERAGLARSWVGPPGREHEMCK